MLNEFPGVDFYEFERYTAELQQLGFVWQTDYRTQTSKVGHPTGIARVMLHPDRRCFVEIAQLNNRGKDLRVHCSIMSYALRQHNGGTDTVWMLSTTNREILSTAFALRHSWSYGNSMPGAGPVQLLESHLSRRRQIINESGVDVSTDISCKTYFGLIQDRIESRRKMLKKANILLFLLRADLFKLKPRSEWSGTPAGG